MIYMRCILVACNILLTLQIPLSLHMFAKTCIYPAVMGICSVDCSYIDYIKAMYMWAYDFI